jgi:hypothetical protein
MEAEIVQPLSSLSDKECPDRIPSLIDDVYFLFLANGRHF